MITHKEYLEALNIVKKYKEQLETDFQIVSKELNDISVFAEVNSETYLNDTNCSVRLLNVIRACGESFGIEEFNPKVRELSKISIKAFLECRNAGKSTLKELKEICFYAGISLKP